MKQILTVPASVVDLKPRQDRSWKLSFETRELGGEEVALLADHFQGEGWLVFKPNAHINAEEVPEDVAESGTKTPSQRLRGVLFIWWQQKGSKGDFEAFYRTQMEKLIDFIKGQLEQ